MGHPEVDGEGRFVIKTQRTRVIASQRSAKEGLTQPISRANSNRIARCGTVLKCGQPAVPF